MTTSLKLDTDHFDGFFSFMKKAQEIYGKEIPFKAAKTCKATVWICLKDTFFQEIDRPILKSVAEALERQMIALQK